MLARLTAVVALASCDPSPPADVSTPVPDPDAALRPAQARGAIPEQAAVVDYAIEARLDTAEHTIEGHERITWRNRTDHPTDVLPMHLYMNAFRSADTTWMREGLGSHRGQGQGEDTPWGYVDIQRLVRVQAAAGDGGETMQELAWAEGTDPTVMTVELPAPLQPGEEIVLDVDFVTVLPQVFARTGFFEDFYLAGQWFPKVAVLEPDGTWQNHVFGFHSEFYADFGSYDVRIDVPADMVVGATGIRTDEVVDAGRKVVTYHAEMVHDFAWTAWPAFVEAWAEHDGIRIRMLAPPQARADAPAHLAAVEAALDSMQTRFGPYPWSTVTVVQPPPGAEGAGGMEYPTFFTTSDRRQIPQIGRALGFEERFSGTFTTIHEFGHQYFQGLFASNEHAQPWLDEGLNSMSNALVLMDWYESDDPWLFRVAGNPVHLSDLIGFAQRRSSGLQIVDQPADEFTPLVGVYGDVVYRRTAAVMLTLRNLVGHDAFDAAMRSYADRWRFRHPTGADLEAALVETLGRTVEIAQADPALDGSGPVYLDVAGYLDQGFRSTRFVDFRLHRVETRALPSDAGYRRDEAGQVVGGDDPPKTDPDALPDEAVEGVVVVHREGTFEVPVEIEVEFEDGETQRVVWSGHDRFALLRFAGRRVVRAHIDPDHAVLLEVDRLDNHRWASRHEQPDPVPRGLADFAQAAALAIMGGLGP